mmetsp:Transcript_17940/g.44802  ORF Transcript_17940/g.44802 Transcript_17940/m.44802 type:complete len:274 (+) Transcript_17940:105-926(+)|eukprot:CAMPEP_0178993596 /NCGR_PEP_ID=MMETSP0795-20121207/6790_1 /TAXON_ID=88552 /ORGANISM="Amoebophrya sp., Strain Ameob2" /LENGTH=273 /DNA_ID=CAMNT_0020685671 /DNA_START=79 /DNA_END=900 /DNA_ORIENTATION=+
MKPLFLFLSLDRASSLSIRAAGGGRTSGHKIFRTLASARASTGCVVDPFSNTTAYTYLGCYTDNGSRTMLTNGLPHMVNVGSGGVEQCARYCGNTMNVPGSTQFTGDGARNATGPTGAVPYAYFAVQYAFQCFCSNDWGKVISLGEKSGGCNVCNQNADDAAKELKCGGSWANSVYATPIPGGGGDISWTKYDNFCVDADGNDQPQTNHVSGDESVESCKSACLSDPACSAIEWYDSGWGNSKCKLMLGLPKSTQGKSGTRHEDATCYVKECT